MRFVPCLSHLPRLNITRTVDALVKSLEESLSVLSIELTPIHERLVTIRRQLVALAAKEGSHKAELKPLQEELRKIDSLSTIIRSTTPVAAALSPQTLIYRPRRCTT